MNEVNLANLIVKNATFCIALDNYLQMQYTRDVPFNGFRVGHSMQSKRGQRPRTLLAPLSALGPR